MKDAEFIIHPECSCTTPIMYDVADVLDKKLVSEFSIVKGKKVVPFNGWDSDLTEYLDLYNELAGK